MPHSPLPFASTQPTGAAYRPRSMPSSSRISSMAVPDGVPPTAAVGCSAAASARDEACSPSTPPVPGTCVAASRDDVNAVIRGYAEAGVRHIVALRGDPPTGFDAPYEIVPGGYRSTAELVADAAKMGFEVSVGTYPERHPQSPTLLHDIEILKQKVDAGATRAITQFFFDNTAYFRFLDVAAAAGLDVPIVPGIFPVQNFKQTANFARRTGASVPQWLADRFEGLEDDAATRRLVAAAVCAEQVLDLIDHGVKELHFYTMNRADLVFAICHLVGLRATPMPVALAEQEPPAVAVSVLG